MKDSKLIRLLGTFSKEEWKEFEKFAASPYFNKGRNYIPLIKELKKFFPSIDSEKLTKKYLYKKIYSGKPFKEFVINTISSGLKGLCEDFLVYESFRNNYDKTPLMIRELSIKNMNAEVESIIKRSDKNYSENKLGAYDYYDRQFMKEEILNHYIRNDDRVKESEYLVKTFIVTAYHFLNQAYIIRNYLFINRNFLGPDYKNNLIDKVMHAIDTDRIIKELTETDEIDAVQFLVAYYSFMANSSEDNYEYFNKIKALFNKYSSKLDKSMQVRFKSLLTNICLRNITLGKSEFHYEFEQIYSVIIRNKEYYIDDREHYFDKRLFKAIIVTSLYLKKINWAEEFLKNYIGRIDPQFKEHQHQYGLACIEFSKSNFEKALDHAAKIEQKQVIYKIDTKNLMARIYYETKSFESLLSIIDSYKHLIKNSSLQDEDYSSSHSGFIKVTEGLVKIIQKGKSKNEVSKLKHKTEKMNQLNNKSWLLEKIDELETSN
ncbi:MAG: hypothetical protein K8I03_13140 [Ignavibacteria bacterium]|nr:hypothetical protein [Ignavibacteria bacterium]